jgi:hypothetical protein
MNIYNMRLIATFENFLNESLSLSTNEIQLLDECTKGTWEEKDGVINIEGDFIAAKKINGKSLSPMVFGRVTGIFDISDNKLESLEGCPREVKEFNCSRNLLNSLEGGPESAEDYYCANNYLITLDGISKNAQNISAPGNSLESIEALGGRNISGNLFLHENFLNDLNGCPQEIGKSLDISSCNLNSLEDCARKVMGNFDCSNNNLKGLSGGPEFVGGYYDCGNNSITSLEGISSNKMKWIDASNNQIYSVIDLPPGLANAKVGLHKNALPLEILRSQQEFVEDKGDSNLRNWLEYTLKNESEERYSPLPRMIEMFNDKKREDAVIEFIKKTDLAGISNDEPKLLAPIATGVNKNSPMVEYVNKNKDLFSDEFLDSLEISSDLKDLGF